MNYDDSLKIYNLEIEGAESSVLTTVIVDTLENEGYKKTNCSGIKITGNLNCINNNDSISYLLSISIKSGAYTAKKFSFAAFAKSNELADRKTAFIELAVLLLTQLNSLSVCNKGITLGV